MPLAFITKARAPVDYRGRRPTAARDKALREHMEGAFSADLRGGVTWLRSNVSRQQMADAYFDKDYSAVVKAVGTPDLKDRLKDVVSTTYAATAAGHAGAMAQLPDLNALRYDLRNPRIKAYVKDRTGILIQGVTEDMRQSVSAMVSMRFGSGLSTADMKATLATQLSQSIGLDTVSSTALANRRNSGKYTDRQLDSYADELLQRRANRIARTEVQFAMNEGRLATFDAAQEQGLISQEARKVWICDANPCHLCEPMDGLSVLLSEDFLSPDGVTVPAPPLHPNCFCMMQLDSEGDDDVPGSGF